MVVVVGENVACALLPPELLHAYWVPPDAVRVALCPLQMATVDGLMLTEGNALTIRFSVITLSQPAALTSVSK